MDKLTEAASPYTQLKEENKKLKSELSDVSLVAKQVRSQNKMILVKLDCIKKDRRSSKYASMLLFSFAAIVQAGLYFEILKFDGSSELAAAILKVIG